MELRISHPSVSSLHMGSRRLLRNNETLVFWVQLFVDVFVVVGSFILLTYWKLEGFPPHYRFLAIITALAVAGIYISRGVYSRSASPLHSALRVTIAWFLCLFFLLILGFSTKTTDLFSRQVLMTWVLSALSLQIASHILIAEAIIHYRSAFTKALPALIVGRGAVAKHLAKSLNDNRWLRDRVIGVVRGNDEIIDNEYEEALTVPILGSVENLRDTIKAHKIRRIYIALPLSESDQIEGLYIDLLDLNVDLIWTPDIFAMNLLNHSVREVAGLPLISLNESPLTGSRVSILLKDVMDRSIAAVGLVLLTPFMIAVAIAVKRSSPGPVFFKQDRHGFDGEVVKVWKFRSMKLHEDKGEVKQATRGDSRVTKVGAFIRKTSIDELPQLINVLQGTMSLVGPRPHAVAHNDYYSDKINSYLSRHRIKPGITGLAQISGYRGETETLDKMQKRVEYDLAYINNWSLWLDTKILIKTPFSLFAKNIY